MDVATHRQRARQISPFNGARASVTASQNRAGGVVLERVEVDPVEVQPRGTIQVQVNFREDMLFVGVGPELCAPGGLFGSGVAVVVTITPSWGLDSADDEYCVPVFTTKSGRGSVSAQFAAPELPDGQAERSESIEARIQIRGKPDQVATQSVPITVSTGGRPNPRDPGNGGNGGGGPFLPCFIDPNRSCEGFETVAWAMAGVFILSVVLD